MFDWVGGAVLRLGRWALQTLGFANAGLCKRLQTLGRAVIPFLPGHSLPARSFPACPVIPSLPGGLIARLRHD